MPIDEFPKDHRNWTFSLTLTKMKEVKKSGKCFNNKILSDLLGVDFSTLGVIESDKITLAGSAEIIELVVVDKGKYAFKGVDWTKDPLFLFEGEEKQPIEQIVGRITKPPLPNAPRTWIVRSGAQFESTNQLPKDGDFVIRTISRNQFTYSVVRDGKEVEMESVIVSK